MIHIKNCIIYLMINSPNMFYFEKKLRFSASPEKQKKQSAKFIRDSTNNQLHI